MDKKWFATFSFVVLLLAGCGIEEAAKDKKTEAKAKQTEQKKESETAVKQEDTKQEEAKREEVKQEEKQEEQKASQPSQQTAEQINTNQQLQSKSTAVQKAAPAPQQQPSPNQQPSQPAQPTPPPKQEPVKETAVVTLSIRGDGGMILGKTEVEWQEHDTVFTVLARTVKKKGIQMEYSGSGNAIYVQGINNLYEKDRGPKSGWMYRVNGTYAKVSAGSYSVKKGDSIEWVYSIDGGQP
jgi:uncharacterized phage infection (PIP) family protein YhgE